MKAYTYKEYTDKELVEGEIPADMLDKAKAYRQHLIEAAVEADDALMEKYLEGHELTTDELKAASARACSPVSSSPSPVAMAAA